MTSHGGLVCLLCVLSPRPGMRFASVRVAFLRQCMLQVSLRSISDMSQLESMLGEAPLGSGSAGPMVRAASGSCCGRPLVCPPAFSALAGAQRLVFPNLLRTYGLQPSSLLVAPYESRVGQLITSYVSEHLWHRLTSVTSRL